MSEITLKSSKLPIRKSLKKVANNDYHTGPSSVERSKSMKSNSATNNTSSRMSFVSRFFSVLRITKKTRREDYSRYATRMLEAPATTQDAKDRLLALASNENPNLIYAKMEKLGEGSAGSVYKGAYMDADGEVQEVAMKFIRKDSDYYSIMPLLNEAEVLSNYSHPNITGYRDCFMQEDAFLLVMEYVPGVSLADVVRNNIRMTRQQLATVIKEILLGLASLHANHIIHRDIKSLNILLSTSGVTKITDLGLCVYENDQPTDRMGSKYWMAPEVLKKYQYNCQADIWSLGCTVIEICDGKLPQYDTDLVEAWWNVVNNKMPKLSRWVRCDPMIKSFVEKCLTFNPLKRPTAVDLLEHKLLRDCAPAKEIADLVKLALLEK